MTQDEAEQFLSTYALLAFNQVGNWLREQKDPNVTFTLWAKVLRACERQECEDVIDAWLEGTIKAPEAYERDQWATHLRACVMHRRSERARRNAMDDQRDAVLHGGRPYSLAADRVYLEWQPIKAMVEAGSISKQEALRQWNEKLEVVFAGDRRVQGVV